MPKLTAHERLRLRKQGVKLDGDEAYEAKQRALILQRSRERTEDAQQEYNVMTKRFQLILKKKRSKLNSQRTRLTSDPRSATPRARSGGTSDDSEEDGANQDEELFTPMHFSQWRTDHSANTAARAAHAARAEWSAREELAREKAQAKSKAEAGGQLVGRATGRDKQKPKVVRKVAVRCYKNRVGHFHGHEIVLSSVDIKPLRPGAATHGEAELGARVAGDGHVIVGEPCFVLASTAQVDGGENFDAGATGDAATALAMTSKRARHLGAQSLYRATVEAVLPDGVTADVKLANGRILHRVPRQRLRLQRHGRWEGDVKGVQKTEGDMLDAAAAIGGRIGLKTVQEGQKGPLPVGYTLETEKQRWFEKHSITNVNKRDEQAGAYNESHAWWGWWLRRVTKPSQDSESDDLPPGEDYDNLEHMFVASNEDVNVVENPELLRDMRFERHYRAHRGWQLRHTTPRGEVAFTEDYGMPDEYDRLVTTSDHESAVRAEQELKNKVVEELKVEFGDNPSGKETQLALNRKRVRALDAFRTVPGAADRERERMQIDEAMSKVTQARIAVTEAEGCIGRAKARIRIRMARRTARRSKLQTEHKEARAKGVQLVEVLREFDGCSSSSEESEDEFGTQDSHVNQSITIADHSTQKSLTSDSGSSSESNEDEDISHLQLDGVLLHELPDSAVRDALRVRGCDARGQRQELLLKLRELLETGAGRAKRKQERAIRRGQRRSKREASLRSAKNVLEDALYAWRGAKAQMRQGLKRVRFANSNGKNDYNPWSEGVLPSEALMFVDASTARPATDPDLLGPDAPPHQLRHLKGDTSMESMHPRKGSHDASSIKKAGSRRYSLERMHDTTATQTDNMKHKADIEALGLPQMYSHEEEMHDKHGFVSERAEVKPKTRKKAVKQSTHARADLFQVRHVPPPLSAAPSKSVLKKSSGTITEGAPDQDSRVFKAFVPTTGWRADPRRGWLVGAPQPSLTTIAMIDDAEASQHFARVKSATGDGADDFEGMIMGTIAYDPLRGAGGDDQRRRESDDSEDNNDVSLHAGAPPAEADIQQPLQATTYQGRIDERIAQFEERRGRDLALDELTRKQRMSKRDIHIERLIALSSAGCKDNFTSIDDVNHVCIEDQDDNTVSDDATKRLQNMMQEEAALDQRAQIIAALVQHRRALPADGIGPGLANALQKRAKDRKVAESGEAPETEAAKEAKYLQRVMEIYFGGVDNVPRQLRQRFFQPIDGEDGLTVEEQVMQQLRQRDNAAGPSLEQQAAEAMKEAQHAQDDANAIATAGDVPPSVRQRPILKGWVGRALAAAARARVRRSEKARDAKQRAKELRERATQLVEDARTETLRNALLKRQQKASAERSENEVSRIQTALGKAGHVKCLHTTNSNQARTHEEETDSQEYVPKEPLTEASASGKKRNPSMLQPAIVAEPKPIAKVLFEGAVQIRRVPGSKSFQVFWAGVFSDGTLRLWNNAREAGAQLSQAADEVKLTSGVESSTSFIARSSNIEATDERADVPSKRPSARRTLTVARALRWDGQGATSTYANPFAFEAEEQQRIVITARMGHEHRHKVRSLHSAHKHKIKMEKIRQAREAEEAKTMKDNDMSSEEATKRKRQLKRERLQQQRRSRIDRLSGQPCDVIKKTFQPAPKEKVRRTAGEGSHNNDEFEHMWVSRRSKYQGLCASATDASAWYTALSRAAAINKNRQNQRLQAEKGAIERARAIAEERARTRAQDRKTQIRERAALELLKQGGHRKMPDSTTNESIVSKQPVAAGCEEPNADEVDVAVRTAKAQHRYEQQKADEAALAREKHDAKLRLVQEVRTETAQALGGEMTALMALEGIDAKEMLAAKSKAQAKEHIAGMVDLKTRNRIEVARESIVRGRNASEPLKGEVADISQFKAHIEMDDTCNAMRYSLQRRITDVLGNAATTMGEELNHANKLKRDHQHRGEQLQFALAAARAATTNLTATQVSEGKVDDCESNTSESTGETDVLSALLGKRAQNALLDADRVIRAEFCSKGQASNSPNRLTLNDVGCTGNQDACDTDAHSVSDADSDHEPAPRSAQSISASSASAAVVAQEVNQRSRGELREGEWQTVATSKPNIRGDNGIEETLKAAGLAVPDMRQTERPRERSVPMSSLSRLVYFVPQKLYAWKRNHPMGWRLARRKNGKPQMEEVNAVAAASTSGSTQNNSKQLLSLPTTSREMTESSQSEEFDRASPNQPAAAAPLTSPNSSSCAISPSLEERYMIQTMTRGRRLPRLSVPALWSGFASAKTYPERYNESDNESSQSDDDRILYRPYRRYGWKWLGITLSQKRKPMKEVRAQFKGRGSPAKARRRFLRKRRLEQTEKKRADAQKPNNVSAGSDPSVDEGGEEVVVISDKSCASQVVDDSHLSKHDEDLWEDSSETDDDDPTDLLAKAKKIVRRRHEASEVVATLRRDNPRVDIANATGAELSRKERKRRRRAQEQIDAEVDEEMERLKQMSKIDAAAIRLAEEPTGILMRSKAALMRTHPISYVQGVGRGVRNYYKARFNTKLDEIRGVQPKRRLAINWKWTEQKRREDHRVNCAAHGGEFDLSDSDDEGVAPPDAAPVQQPMVSRRPMKSLRAPMVCDRCGAGCERLPGTHRLATVKSNEGGLSGDGYEDLGDNANQKAQRQKAHIKSKQALSKVEQEAALAAGLQLGPQYMPPQSIDWTERRAMLDRANKKDEEIRQHGPLWRVQQVIGAVVRGAGRLAWVAWHSSVAAIGGNALSRSGSRSRVILHDDALVLCRTCAAREIGGRQPRAPAKERDLSEGHRDRDGAVRDLSGCVDETYGEQLHCGHGDARWERSSRVFKQPIEELAPSSRRTAAINAFRAPLKRFIHTWKLKRQRRAFHDAVLLGDGVKLSKIMSQGLLDENIVRYRDQEGRTPLTLAAAQNDTVTAEYLLNIDAMKPKFAVVADTKSDQDIDIDTGDFVQNWSALHWAAYNGNGYLASALLSHGAALHNRTRSGSTPLMIACAEGRIATVHVLLGADESLDAVKHVKVAQKDYAAWRKRVTRQMFMSPKLRDRNGMTALHHAACAGSLECCAALLQSNFDPLAKDKSHAVPAHYARESGSDMIAIMLNDAAYGDDWARHPTAGHHFTDERFLSSFKEREQARRKRNKRIRMQNDRRVMQEQEDFDAREHMAIYGKPKPSWWYGKDARDNREGDRRQDQILAQLHQGHVAFEARRTEMANERAMHYQSLDWREVVDRNSTPGAFGLQAEAENTHYLDGLPDRCSDNVFEPTRTRAPISVKKVLAASDMVDDTVQNKHEVNI